MWRGCQNNWTWYMQHMVYICYTSSAPHYSDVILSTMLSQIITLTIVYSSVYSVSDKRKHKGSASLAFVRGIPRWPVNSPHKRPVMRKMFPFDDVIMSKFIQETNPPWIINAGPYTIPRESVRRITPTLATRPSAHKTRSLANIESWTNQVA